MANDRDLPERIVVVETEQQHIKSSLKELVTTSKQTHDTLLSLSKGFESLSTAMGQLSELERSSMQHTDHLISQQKAVATIASEVEAIKTRNAGKDKITDRIITGGIVTGILVLYNVLPLPDFLKLMLGFLL
jgi:hypothetical protein